jgi:hypothetical protein
MMSALSLLTPNWPDLPTNIAAFTTLRSGGTSIGLFDDGNGCGGFNVADHVGDDRDHVRRNREVLMDLLPNSPQWLTQVHGTNVLNLDRTPTELTADACITTQPNEVCAV